MSLRYLLDGNFCDGAGFVNSQQWWIHACSEVSRRGATEGAVIARELGADALDVAAKAVRSG
eukprot:1201707-Amphidinium_carterae.2